MKLLIIIQIVHDGEIMGVSQPGSNMILAPEMIKKYRNILFIETHLKLGIGEMINGRQKTGPLNDQVITRVGMFLIQEQINLYRMMQQKRVIVFRILVTTGTTA